jgi:hypothetical protein
MMRDGVEEMAATVPVGRDVRQVAVEVLGGSSRLVADLLDLTCAISGAMMSGSRRLAASMSPFIQRGRGCTCRGSS